MPVGRFKSGTQNVDVAGTAEALVATDTYVKSVGCKARDGNTGDIYIGDSTIDNPGPPVPPGQSIEVSDDDGIEFNLADIYVDAANNDDDVDFWYLER